MLRYIGIIIFLALLLIFSVNSNLKRERGIEDKNIKKRNALRLERKVDEKLAEELKKKDCIEFIQLLSVQEIAKEYGKTEEWVAKNHYVNLWKETSEDGKGGMAGLMRVATRAMILEEIEEDYKVQSPIGDLIGWVNKIQVAKTIFLNPSTLVKCK